MSTFETTESLSKPMRVCVRHTIMLIVLVLDLLVSPVRVSATDLAKTASAVRGDGKRVREAQEWTKVEGVKREAPVQRIYPLKSLEDLKTVLFVAVHPYNAMYDPGPKWGRISDGYNIQFLDRAPALLCVNYREQFDPKWVEFSKGNKIVTASYSILHPIHASELWSFADNYYKRLPKEQKWRDLAGNIIEDPYEGGGAEDIFGSILKQDDGRRIYMSLNNPHWFNYELDAAEYAISHGIDAIDVDMMGATPFRLGGDFSEWSARGFNRYLEAEFTTQERHQMGITDLSGFDVRRCVMEGYVEKAVRTVTLPAHLKFFNMDPLLKPVEDALLREFIKYNYHALIDFHRKLSLEVKKRGSERGRVIPYFGNLYVGGPSDLLSSGNNGVLLSPVADIIQLETCPAVPPKERGIITYRIGWAMSEKKKPTWSLSSPSDLYETTIVLKQLYLAECFAAGAVPEIDIGGYPSKDNKWGMFVAKDGEVYPEFKKYTDFVRDNQQYFKNVEPYSRIGLVYSVPSFMWRTFPLFGISYDELRKLFVGYARALEEAHLQYDVLIFGMPGFWDDSKMLRDLSNYDVLILPDVYSASDMQLDALEDFLRNGGKLILVGRDVLSRDEEYRERDKTIISRLLGGRPGQVIFRDEKYVTGFHDNTIQKGIKDLTNYNNLISAVIYKFQNQLETNAPREIGLNVLRQDGRLIIHFINYDYDMASDSFRVKKDIEFKLGDKLPVKEIKKILLLSPDFDETLYIEKPTGRSFVIPELKIWNTVVVE